MGIWLGYLLSKPFGYVLLGGGTEINPRHTTDIRSLSWAVNALVFPQRRWLGREQFGLGPSWLHCPYRDIFLDNWKTPYILIWNIWNYTISYGLHYQVLLSFLMRKHLNDILIMWIYFWARIIICFLTISGCESPNYESNNLCILYIAKKVTL